MMDNRSELVKKLMAMMPESAVPKWDPKMATSIMPFKTEPIRHAAEVFANVIEYELPKDRTELIALLWTFGEILDGDLNRTLEHSQQIISDYLSMSATPKIGQPSR